MNHTGSNFVIIGSDFHGCRLDRALTAIEPILGLRGRRRLISDGRVLVNGIPKPAGYKVVSGERLEVTPPCSTEFDWERDVRVVSCTEGYCAIHKPAGLHTEHLSGRTDPTVEALLPRLLPGTSAILVNRLDLPTSGVVVAANSTEAADAYRHHEDTGQIEKVYLAVVHGVVDAPLLVQNKLDTDSRRMTKVLPTQGEDPLRWTAASPLVDLDQPVPSTLLWVKIRKGARHQIRAHLASVGHPIVGDDLYGPQNDTCGLRLHHAQISFPGFAAEDAPDWPELSGSFLCA